MSRHPLVKSAWLSILFLVAALLAACGGELEESRPRVWIAAPLNGSHHELGTIKVMSHSSCKTGISELALLVNGQEYRRRAPDNAGATLITNVQTWDPPAEGQYTLQVVAYTRGGLASEPATVQVTIGAPRGTTPPTVAPATPPPVAPGELTLTPTTAPPPEGGPTFTPTYTPSSESPTHTPTSPAPARAPEISYFEAYPTTISAGACSDLRWGVEYATAVFLDGQGVVDHDTTRVCPGRTTSYTLVARSAGGERQASLTVTVTEAPTATSVPDKAGPEISDVQRSAGVIYFPYPYPNSPCDRPTEVTITARVTDPSGVARVRLVRRIGSGEPQAKDMTPIGGDLYQATMSGPSQITTIDYLIRAWDTLDNLRDGGRGTIEVQRCD